MPQLFPKTPGIKPDHEAEGFCQFAKLENPFSWFKIVKRRKAQRVGSFFVFSESKGFISNPAYPSRCFLKFLMQEGVKE